jgi:DSF synthase
MGAYSFVARRCGTRVADKLIASGEILAAEQMHELGLVDVLAEKGQAAEAVRHLMKNRRRSTNGLRALNRARLHTPFHVPFEELLAVTEEWVQAAAHLSPAALRTMERLVRAQNRLTH